MAPRLKHQLTEGQLDRQVLYISRVATVVVLVLCAAIAWAWVETNVMLIVWIGTGGVMSAFAGSLVFGALWRGVTRAGAYAGLVSGFVSFLVLHAQLLDPAWFAAGTLRTVIAWLYTEGANPFSCSSIASLTSVAFTIVVSKATRHCPSRTFGRCSRGCKTRHRRIVSQLAFSPSPQPSPSRGEGVAMPSPL